MEKKLYGYLGFLEDSGKSKSSIKNYKADIKQFLKWRSENAPESSLSESYAMYKDFLETKYSESSVARKESSIKSFIKYAYPFEDKKIAGKHNSNKSLLYLTAFSVLLSFTVLLIVLFPIVRGRSFESGNYVKLNSVPNHQFYGTENISKLNEKEGIVLSVSAPEIENEDANERNILITTPCVTN